MERKGAAVEQAPLNNDAVQYGLKRRAHDVLQDVLWSRTSAAVRPRAYAPQCHTSLTVAPAL